MKIRSLKHITMFLLVTISLITSSCGGQNNNQNVSEVQVSKTDLPNTDLANTEEFPLPNCGGSSELAQTLGTQASVRKAITISGTATVSGGGEFPISTVVKGKLEAEISAAYSETFQNESSRLDSIVLKAAPATHVVYVIQWINEQYSSSVSYILEGKTYDTNYVYTLRVPKISDSYSESCPNTSGSSQPPVTGETNWVFTLEYPFPSEFWSTGAHSYSFEFNCPNEVSEGVTREFAVSDTFSLVPGNVYLRWGSQKVGSLWGEAAEGINPSQPTIAAIVWDGIPQSEATWRAANCTGTISWDGGAKQPLTPQTPFQH